MENTEIILGIIFMAIGFLSLICSVFNVEWFFKTNNASIFVNKFGRLGARIIYSITGIAIIIVSVLLFMGRL